MSEEPRRSLVGFEASELRQLESTKKVQRSSYHIQCFELLARHRSQAGTKPSAQDVEVHCLDLQHLATLLYS